MCGRVRLSTDHSEIRIKLRLDPAAPAPNYEPDWNKPPTAPMLTVTLTEGGKRASQIMRWGLIPRWAKDAKVAFSTFNARAETIATTNAFRDSWRQGKRCLVPVDGFYEWRKSDKQPFAVGMADGGVMVMAGLWEDWTSRETGEVVRSCTIITTRANDVIGALHDRMPVVLGEADWPKWLGETPATPEELRALLAPCPSDWLRLWPVDKRVGNVRNTGPELAEPLIL